MGRFGHASILGLFLIVTGVAIFTIKTAMLGYPVNEGETAPVWDLELYIEFEGRNEPARIETFLPVRDVARGVTAEQFYNGPFGLGVIDQEQTGNRKAVWTYRYPDNKKVLRYAARTSGETTATPFPQSFRDEKPEGVAFEADPIKRQAFIIWTGNIRQRSADNRSFADLTLQAVFEKTAGGDGNIDELDVLLGNDKSTRARLELARRAMQAQGVPARVVNGVYLGDSSRREQIKHWIEYHIDGRDYRYFPAGAPRRYLPMWYGVEHLINAQGVDRLDVKVGLQRRTEASVDAARGREGRVAAFGRAVGFDELPLTTQLVYQVLVTIPVGITILVFLRQFVGIQTIGTFMPVLIGIAFRETALINGLALFTLLIALGLALRFYLERLQLLLVPRLAVVLVFIVIVMAGVTIFMGAYNQSVGLSISLFPMVIVAMTIERMSIVWEETSAGEAVKQGLGSLAVASLSYIVMSNSHVEYLMFQFPELLLALMGLCVLMGRYTGLRLSEIWRFRPLVGG